MKKFFLVLLTFSLSALSSETLEMGTSVSHFYRSRSTFGNPAGLGYHQALNGTQMDTSISWAGIDQGNDEFSLGISWGFLGLGLERLSEPRGEFRRYSIAGGFDITPSLYLGERVSFTGSDVSALSGVTSFDMGIQYRPSPYVALGLLMEKINQPTEAGVKLPTGFLLGVAVQPISRLLLTGDIGIQSNNWDAIDSYRGMAHFEVLPSFWLSGGYDKTDQWNIGVRLSFGESSLSTNVRTLESNRALVTRAEFSTQMGTSIIPLKKTVKWEIGEDLSEEGATPTFFSSGRPSLMGVIRSIDKASSNPEITTLFISIEKFPLGLAAAQEIHEALLKAREKGKTVEVALGNGDLKEYLIASSANRISMSAGGNLRFLGPKTERYYLKGTLDKIGIEANLMAKGEYKSAPESLNRKESSTQSRENSLSILDDIEKELLSLLKKGGHVDEKKWAEARKLAVLSPSEAKRLGLIDSIENATTRLETLDENGIVSYYRELGREDLSLPKRIAVVHATGDILPERNRFLSFSGAPQVTPDRMKKLLDAAVADPLTSAIVLRVSSPGGDVLASDQIGSLIEKAGAKKPIVVSMGDIAASGGYYIAAPGKKILANSTTLTGSIGVFSGKISLAGLYKKIDLNKEILSRAPFAGLLSESRSWLPEEKAILSREIDAFYVSFVEYVSRQRKISAEKAEKAAKGRVWTGNQALQNQLVDQMGGLQQAVEEAAKLANLTRYDVWTVRPQRGMFDFFGEEGFFAKEAEPILSSGPIRELSRLGALSNSAFLYWYPGTAWE